MNAYKLISDPDIINIIIKESGEGMVNVSNYKNLVVLNKRRRSNPYFSYVRREIYDKLKDIASNLPKDVILGFEEGLRPLAIQKQIFDLYLLKLKEASPPLYPYELLVAKAMEYVALPEGCPPHSTGGAVDITLFDRQTRKELDMGSCSDDTPVENGTLNNTFSQEISPEAYKNRSVLIEHFFECRIRKLPG